MGNLGLKLQDARDVHDCLRRQIEMAEEAAAAAVTGWEWQGQWQWQWQWACVLPGRGRKEARETSTLSTTVSYGTSMVQKADAACIDDVGKLVEQQQDRLNVHRDPGRHRCAAEEQRYQ